MSLYQSILLVDDDADDQHLFNDAIHCVDSSIRFDWADNGFHALNKLNNTKLLPELIFIDLNMPLINGFDLIAQLKGSGRFSHIPLVAFTTSKSQSDMLRAKLLGANAFLSKPDDYHELCRKLRHIVNSDLVANADEVSELQFAF